MENPDSIPLPLPSPLTQPFWDAAARGELAIQRCDACDRFTHPPRPECASCAHTGLGYERVSGRGRLETFSVVHRTFAPGFRSRVPYAIAWVELEEQAGLRLLTGIVGTEPEALEIDAPVEVEFTELAGFGPIPQFRVAETHAGSAEGSGPVVRDPIPSGH